MLGRLKNTIITIAMLILAISIASIPLAHAAGQPLVVVEVFSEDRVHLDIGDTTHVTRTLVIKNEIDKPIVPGIITIVLQKQTPEKIGPVAIPFTSVVKPLKVMNVKARMGDGAEIKDVKVTETENSTIIQYGAWVPIEPKQTLTVILEYDSPDIVEKGLLFSTLQYPFTSSSIPVEKAIIETSIKSGHITYSSEKPTINGNTYVYENSSLGMNSWGVALEYSILPLPLLPISGSTLLWGIILLACLIWVVWTYTRPHKRK